MTEWQQRLVERLKAARGEQPVDLLLRGGRVLNVFTGELMPAAVAVFDGLWSATAIARLERWWSFRTLCSRPDSWTAHVHLESSLLLPAEFARAVLPTALPR